MATFNNERIKEIVYEVRASRHPNKAAIFSAKYREFCREFPKLFGAALDDTFPLKYLDFMLMQRESLAQQPVTEDSVKAHDQVVYDHLRKDYIDPLLPPADSS